ncbi:ArdC family protein [Poseidonibacter lekithochrous]|uniref:ArdC family protein n=1 Tax=Poseidonibacter lekithochrous TaxID=1904463 RepID=UPI000D37C6B4|nr:zincin-like metallopeptidase domain-containing protein [Poseidonibacter lekithochrous]
MNTQNKKQYPTTQDKFNKIVENFISELENGVEPWKKSWSSKQLPKNFISDNNYNGINILTLMDTDFKDNRFLTFNQIKQLGGSINKGEKSKPIFFLKSVEKETVDEEGNKTTEKYFIMQSYQVFNIEQTSSIKYEKTYLKSKNYAIELAQEFIDNMNIPVYAGEPSYSIEYDSIFMPTINEFKDSYNYYSTYFHELSHSTGHSSRMNRPMDTRFGSKEYAKEELIAELSSSFLCGEFGVDMKTTQHSQYLNSWIETLKEKPMVLFQVASAAAKSANYLKNIHETKQEIKDQNNHKNFSPKPR